MDTRLSKKQRQQKIAELLLDAQLEVAPEHKHVWYVAGTIRHPRMGWHVDFYLCTEIHWSVDHKCVSVALGDGVAGDSTAGQEFDDFNKAYYYLGAP